MHHALLLRFLSKKSFRIILGGHCGKSCIYDLFNGLQVPEELTLDYAEITSIPPLPLWTLLEADKELTGKAQACEEVKVMEDAPIVLEI